MSQSIVGVPPAQRCTGRVTLFCLLGLGTPSAAPARSLVWEADCSEFCDSSVVPALDLKSKGPESSGARSPLGNLAPAVGVNVASGKPLWAEGPNYELAQAFFPGRDPTAAAGTLTEPRRSKSLFLRTRFGGLKTRKRAFSHWQLAVGTIRNPTSQPQPDPAAGTHVPGRTQYKYMDRSDPWPPRRVSINRPSPPISRRRSRP